MSNSKDIKADRQTSGTKPTPAKILEPTLPIWKKGGDTSVTDAISRDKSSVRKPVGN